MIDSVLIFVFLTLYASLRRLPILRAQALCEVVAFYYARAQGRRSRYD